ncbi:AAA family ATPase [Adhaeribacter rhizoryzae]|uniref:AAA family ATPase n=1 Tax=Adhaeribacter rhizoryzae TaxID=2607907 RepID=A0A5M6DJS2_9BACT|nr:ATP-binding protein [Adhaeribacter rhizoryzae]KAA5547794.1 AAA family ATPase [Adhaeribacter rhizoryzae]
MKINQIEISNYRSCIDTKFELATNLTALIGINGVGKSSILYSLQLFSKSDRNRRFFVNEGKEELLNTQINLQITIDERVVLVRSSFFYETDERNLDEVFYTEVKYRFLGEKSKKWQLIDSEIFEVVEYIKRKPLIILPKQFQSETSKFSINLVKTLSSISYYSATQFSDPSKCPISIELEDYRINPKLRASKNHQMFIYDLYRAQNSKESTFELFLNTVGANGLELIESIDFHVHEIPSSSYKVRTGGKIQKIESTKKIIVPSIEIDGLKLSPNQLSEGTFKTLALVFYILNDKNEILLIEEPEVSVHHGLLNSIIELIKQQSKFKQIIVSTHSDYVLDMLSPENILLVRKKGVSGTKAQSLTKALSKNDYEALKNYLQTRGNLGEYWKEGGFESE